MRKLRVRVLPLAQIKTIFDMLRIISNFNGTTGYSPLSSSSYYDVHYRFERDGSLIRISLKEFFYRILTDSERPRIDNIMYEAVKRINEMSTNTVRIKELEMEMEKKWEEMMMREQALQISRYPLQNYGQYGYTNSPTRTGSMSTIAPTVFDSHPSPVPVPVPINVLKDTDVYYLLTS